MRAEKAVKPAESEVREQKPVDEQVASDTETQGQQSTDEQTEQGASSKPRRRRHRGAAVPMPRLQPRRSRRGTRM